jgi:hypothetical protein
MCDFNAANELAAMLVCGRHYQGDEPCFKLTKIVFHHGNGLDSEDKVVVEDDGQTDWAAVANRIQALLGQGYDWTTLPCEYCGATELEDVLHCDECGEAVPHGHEHPDIDEDGDDVTYCDGCQPGHDNSSRPQADSPVTEFDVEEM